MKTTRAEEVQNPEVLHRKVRVEKCQAYWNGAKDSIHKMLIGKREGREGVGQKGKGAQENVCFPQPPPHLRRMNLGKGIGRASQS